MAALDFPTAPSNGDTYEGYIYDATRQVWNVNELQRNARYTISATAPANPVNGDAWFDSSEGVTYVYYYDGNNGQWVETGNPVLSFLNIATANDIDLTALANGQILVYNSSTQKWENETLATAGIAAASHTHTTDDITSFDIDEPVNGDILVYDTTSGVWQNKPQEVSLGLVIALG